MSLTPPHSSLKTEELLDLLTSLVQKSMVVYEEDEQGNGRYRLLETVRQYARDRLVEIRDAEAVQGRHLQWCLQLAEEADAKLRGRDQGAWLERLQTEHDNLRTALDWTADMADMDAAVRLVGALGQFWNMRGYWSAGREHLSGLLGLQGASAGTAARARMLNLAGRLAWNQGDYAAARTLHEESLTIFQELGDQGGVAASLHNLGNVESARANYEVARKLYEESLGIRRELGASAGTAALLGNLAGIAVQQGDYGRARAAYEESLAIARRRGDPQGIAYCLGRLGRLTLAEGASGEAHTLLSRSLAIFGELGHKPGIAEDLEALSGAAVARSDPERAACLLGAAQALRESCGIPLRAQGRARYDEYVAAARAALDEAAFTAAWAEGRAMSLEEAVAYAMDGGDEP